MKKTLVLGYFGYPTNKLDGQTVKTRNVYKILCSKMSNSDINYFDTEDLKYSKKSIWVMLVRLWNCKQLIYLPANNNLKYIFPIIYILSVMRGFEIIYIVIGGWLVDFLKDKWLHRKLLSKIKIICPENELVRKNLQINYNIRNVTIFPNFRIQNYKPIVKASNNSLRLVFMSRVTKSKGIDIVFKIADYIKLNYKSTDIIIDFYGPINQEDKSDFELNVNKYSFVSYSGVIQPNNIYKTLSKYDLMIFPTSYKGEGFPGAIIDAYISGIPVLASDWKYNSECIDNGITGYICDLKDIEQFCKVIDDLFINREKLLLLKYNALKKSMEYSPDKAWEIISPNLI